MENIESFSKYISELAKEKKYQNILISFKNTSSEFKIEEIAQNHYLVRSLIDAYRHEKQLSDAFEFINTYKIKIDNSQHRLVLNSYGWLLYTQLDKCIKQNESELINIPIGNILNFLSCLNLTEEYFDLLIKKIIVKAATVKKIDLSIALSFIIQILKSIKLRTDKRIQTIVKEDPFVVSAIIGLFGKSGDPDKGFKILKFLTIDVFIENTPEELLNGFGWLLYYKLKKDYQDIEDEVPEEELDTIISEFQNLNADNHFSSESEKDKINSNVLKIIPLLKNDSYSPFSRLFNIYLKIQKKGNKNWRNVLTLCKIVEVDKLTLDCKSVTFNKNGKDKTAELASDKEVWYANYSSALYHTEDYEKCLSICQEGFKVIPKFHYNNEIWFARKIALCKIQFGNIDAAINELESIVKIKNEWFIQKELAELYLEKGNIILSKEFAIKAALNRDEREKKDGLFYLLGNILLKDNNKELSHKHFLLTLFIRQEQEYKIPNDLKIFLTQTKPEGFMNSYASSKELYNELRIYWKSTATGYLPNHDPNSTKKELKGVISKSIIDKGIGFIKGQDEQEYFFRFQDFKSGNPKPGLSVRFKWKKPSDPTKKPIAYDVYT